jgi:hypothetical protein
MAFKYTIGLEVDGASAVNAAAGAVDNLDDGLNDVSDEARAVSSAFGKTAAEAKRMTREFDGADTALLALADHQGDMASQFATFGGPVGNSVARIYELKEAYNKLTLFAGKGTAMMAVAAAGIAALAAVALLAAAAIVALGAALVKAAIGASDAANKVAIMREGLTGSAKAAAGLTSTIDRVAAGVPLSTEKVGELADGLWKAGKRGADLEKALHEASLEAAGFSKNADPALVARRMANLDVIAVKMGGHFQKIFSGAKTMAATDRFGKALAGFVDLFGQNHSEGRALQALMSTIVDPLIDGLTSLIPLATQVFRGMIILALDVAIAVLEARNAILELIPDSVKEAASALASRVDLLAVAITAGKWIAGLFVASLVVVGAILGAVVVAVGALIAVVVGLVAAFAVGVVAIGTFVSDAGGALLDFASMGADAAANMVAGLVAGIKAGVGPVVEAIKAMASSAVSAIKSALKIASPSKIFEDLGGFTGEGFAVGIEGETGAVQSSLETMVAPPSVETPTLSNAGGGPGASGGGSRIDLSGASFVFNGVKDAESSVSLFEEALTRILEGDAVAVGAG